MNLKQAVDKLRSVIQDGEDAKEQLQALLSGGKVSSSSRKGGKGKKRGPMSEETKKKLRAAWKARKAGKKE